MKIRIITGMLAFIAIAIQAQSQHQNDSNIKILPTPQEGVIKIHYAMETTEPLLVRFVTDEGVVSTDKIRGVPYPKGWSKRYDVRKLMGKAFRVEISSPRMAVTYRISPSTNSIGYTAFLEKTEYNQVMVKAHN